MSRKPRFKDIAGQRYGRLIAVRFDAIDQTGVARWLVRCDCGAEKIVSGQALRAGNTKSCGCLQRDATKRYHMRKWRGPTALPPKRDEFEDAGVLDI